MAEGGSKIEVKLEGATHDIKNPRNRGQETMPWRYIQTILNASVFIKGKSPGTGILIHHDHKKWLLTAHTVLPTKASAFTNDDIFHFYFIDKDSPGVAISGKDLLDPTEDWLHYESKEHGLGYTMVAVNNETLDKRLAGRVPEAISWDITAAALDLRRRDHLYAVHYPDPEHIGAYHRCFGGDIIQGAKGAYIFLAMSTWPGSEGAPVFKTDEKSGKPQLVGIFNYSQPWDETVDDEDEAVANIACNIDHIKKHISGEQWTKKDLPKGLSPKIFLTKKN